MSKHHNEDHLVIKGIKCRFSSGNYILSFKYNMESRLIHLKNVKTHTNEKVTRKKELFKENNESLVVSNKP